MDISKDWEKVILLLVALITLFFAQSYIRQSQAYGSQFEIQAVSPSDVLPEMEKETVVTSRNLLEQKSIWTTREIPASAGGEPRQIPLFKSITVVEVGGETIDMSDPKDGLVREPVSNQWLLDNELNFLSSNVLSQDPDGDGYTTLEEWKAKTSPRDPSDHPPFADKLRLLALRQKNYILEFAAMPDAERFQIIRHPSSNHQRATFILRKGETSKDKLFRIDSYTEKEAVNKLGIKVDASELSITYLPDGRSFKLVKRVKELIPTFFGQFKMTVGADTEEFYVKKGDSFRLPIDPETEYKLIDISAEKAVISFESEPGKEVKIEIKLEN